MKRFHRGLLLMLLYILPTLAWAQTLPVGDPTITKPSLLIVEDYKGPDGNGDQGGYVLATFPHTPQHARLAQYRLWREILVSVSFETTGIVRALATPQPKWVPWAVIEANPVGRGQPPLTRAIVPTIDNVATRWAITAEMGNRTPGQTSETEESIRESLALLGIQAVLPQPELEKTISPSYDFTQALLGDQKDLVIGRLDLDGLRQVAIRVPEGVWAQTANLRVSDATIAQYAVRAIDNIPPAAVYNEKAQVNGRQVTLTWNFSSDDRDVGLIPYRGWAVPIYGVRVYDVYRSSTDEQSLVKIASLASGTTTFMDMVDPELGNSLIYRITATDLDNATPSTFVTVALGGEKSLAAPITITATIQVPKTPTEFALHQNFPNPFNPATTIKYDLAENGRVELRVYNVLGQVVRTLINGPQAAGRYTVPWDGRDESGILVSSGMYFYRLTAEKFTSVKKLMLLK